MLVTGLKCAEQSETILRFERLVSENVFTLKIENNSKHLSKFINLFFFNGLIVPALDTAAYKSFKYVFVSLLMYLGPHSILLNIAVFYNPF